MIAVVNVIGGRAPLHITAVGKLFLLEDGPSGLRRIRQAHRSARQYAHSQTSVSALEKDLEKTRRQGYAVDHEEAELGVRCIGSGHYAMMTAPWLPACRYRRRRSAWKAGWSLGEGHAEKSRVL